MRWPQGTPASTMEGLKTAGFNEAPVLSAGRKVDVLVYHRDAAAQQAFHLNHPNGPALYAVVVRGGAWENDPIFVESLPNLLRLIRELEPFRTMFDS